MSEQKSNTNTIKKLHNPKSHAPAVYIPCWLIQVPSSKLSYHAKLIYGRLSQWSTTKGTVTRSIHQLSVELGMNKNTVERGLKELRDVELISTYKKSSGGQNYYKFYEHEWMYEPLTEALEAYEYKHLDSIHSENLTAPSTKSDGATTSNVMVPPIRCDGTPPSDVMVPPIRCDVPKVKENKIKEKDISTSCEVDVSVVKKSKGKSSSDSVYDITPNELLVIAWMNKFPFHPHPRNSKNLSIAVNKAFKSFKRHWYDTISPGNPLTVEMFENYLDDLKSHDSWVVNENKNYSLIVFLRIEAIEDLISKIKAKQRKDEFNKK